MRRRIVVRNYKLRDYTKDKIFEYFKAICPSILTVTFLGFNRFEIDFYQEGE